jgi:hypothetical protein
MFPLTNVKDKDAEGKPRAALRNFNTILRAAFRQTILT